MIKQINGKWHLYSKDGSKHLGGPYDSKDEAVKRERQVQFFKHKADLADDFLVELSDAVLLELTEKAGNINNLAKHIAKHCPDPGMFRCCMNDKALDGYSPETRKAICARAHHIATGRWPAQDKGKAKKAGLIDLPLIELPLIITRADVQPNGSLRWRAITSDTDPDNTGEATTLQLFQNWIDRIEKGETVDWLPPPRQPFLGISHYPAMDGAGEAGITQSMWIRGNRFNAEGVFNQTSLGKALYGAVRSEIDLTAKGQLVQKPIRISAAWWDIQHLHGSFVFTRKSLTDVCPMCEAGQTDNKQYLLGQIDHWAGTRVPINPRTGLSLTERAMSGKTIRKEDAASIVGEEEAEELESKSQLVGKADVTPGLVVKAKKPPMDEEEMDKTHKDEMEEEGEEEENPAPPGKKKPKGGSYLDKSSAFDGVVTLSEAYEHPTQKSYTRLETFALVKRNIEALPETDRLGALSALVDELTDEVQELRTAVEDVYLLQPLYETLDTSEDIPMPTNDYLEQFNEAVATARQGKTTEEKARLMQEALNNVTGAMKAELAGPMDMVQAFKAAINPLAEQLAQLNARLGGVAIPQQTVVMPTQKSATLTPTINDPAQAQNQLPISPITGQPSSITQLTRRSVGLY